MAQTTLVKALVSAGLGSRRAMAQAIKDGRVKLNDNTAESFSQMVDTIIDHLTLDENPVKPSEEEYVYILLNKPSGVLTATRDERGCPTVIDLLPPGLRSVGLHPVGRLDKDSRGLILLTNDGELTYRLTHPRFEKEKEYLLRLDKPLQAEDRQHVEEGVELTDGLTTPIKVQDDSTTYNDYKIIMHEGRKRQLRRIFHNLGYQVRDLSRIRLGSLLLGNLAEGKSRLLTASELRLLRETTGLSVKPTER